MHNDDPNDVLRKAEALLAKHRVPRNERQPAPPVDFPTLTEIVEEGVYAARGSRDQRHEATC